MSKGVMVTSTEPFQELDNFDDMDPEIFEMSKFESFCSNVTKRDIQTPCTPYEATSSVRSTEQSDKVVPFKGQFIIEVLRNIFYSAFIYMSDIHNAGVKARPCKECDNG